MFGVRRLLLPLREKVSAKLTDEGSRVPLRIVSVIPGDPQGRPGTQGD